MKAKFVVLSLLTLGLVGCSSDPTGGASTGILVVRTRATGTDIPPTSIIHIEGLQSTEIPTNGGEGFSRNLVPGPREVELEVPDALCLTANNPRTVNVQAGVNEETFNTTCP